MRQQERRWFTAEGSREAAKYALPLNRAESTASGGTSWAIRWRTPHRPHRSDGQSAGPRQQGRARVRGTRPHRPDPGTGHPRQGHGLPRRNARGAGAFDRSAAEQARPSRNRPPATFRWREIRKLYANVCRQPLTKSRLNSRFHRASQSHKPCELFLTQRPHHSVLQPLSSVQRAPTRTFRGRADARRTAARRRPLLPVVRACPHRVRKSRCPLLSKPPPPGRRCTHSGSGRSSNSLVAGPLFPRT